MVFFQKELSKTVVIHPRFLGKKLRKTVVDTLKADVVGSCIDGAHVIAVLRISDENVSRGVVEPLTGSVRYDVTYRAIMFRPFRNEVLDCVVKQVTALGFFAEAGPLNIFVSRVNIPGDMNLRQDGNAWVSGSGDEIKAETDVRLKILSASVQVTHLAGIGTINEPYLGVLKK